eukprot:14976789-Alexandrium_andersonii.AAC.1
MYLVAAWPSRTTCKSMLARQRRSMAQPYRPMKFAFARRRAKVPFLERDANISWRVLARAFRIAGCGKPKRQAPVVLKPQ